MKNSRVKIANAFFALFVFFNFLFLLSCSEEELSQFKNSAAYDKKEITARTENLNVPSVNFLSVGQGDSAFIIFPDGKTMLIDCGEKDDINFATISTYIDAAGANAIDYLVLSHTDSDHTGNAADIIGKYGVKVAYIPKVLDETNYTAFRLAKEKLDLCGANVKI